MQQLHATNAMLEAYHCDTIPQLLQELEEIYDDLCNIMSEAVLQGAESISAKVGLLWNIKIERNMLSSMSQTNHSQLRKHKRQTIRERSSSSVYWKPF